MRSDAQAIERELGQPFFAWLSERPGADGRAIGAAGAMRIASPQTPEDAEELREQAAAFIASHYPAPAGPTPAASMSAEAYGVAAGEAREAYATETGLFYTGWSGGVRDRAAGAGVPEPGGTEEAASRERVAAETGISATGAERTARETVTRNEVASGRAGVAAETDRPFAEHATESVPVIGGWLAGRLFGTAGNAAPDEMTGEGAGSPDAGRGADRRTPARRGNRRRRRGRG